MEWEEAAGSGGHGQRGGALLYAVGNEVEVRMDDPGFHGAFYEATVSARLPCSDRYEVMYSTLVEGGGGRGRRRRRRGGGPLRETVSAGDAPAAAEEDGAEPGRDLNVFDMVEAYHREGWWPGVVSAGLAGARAEGGGAVPRVPQYDEGSNVEVMLNKGKHRAAWMTATVIKMVSSKNYVVRLKNKERSVDIVDYCYIRLQPILDRKKFKYELEPSAEVEVNLGDVVEISDNSGCDVIHISDDSSCNPRRKRRRQNLLVEELHSQHISHQIQESQSMLNISPARSPLNCDPLLDIMRHPKVQSCKRVVPPSLSLLETPQARSNHSAGQLIPMLSYPVLEKLPVNVLPGMNGTKEQTEDQNYAMPIKVEVKSWAADICKKEEDTSLTTSKNLIPVLTRKKISPAMQTVTDSGEDSSRRPPPGDSDIPVSSKLEPYSSEQQGVEADLPCMPMPNNSIVNALPLLEMNSDTVDFSPKEQAQCDLEFFSTNSARKIIDASHYECYASLQPNSTRPPTTFASSLLMGPCGKMEVFDKLPQVPHFGKLTGYPPELREGKTLGLMVSFANLAESIQNMRIQDKENIFEEKLRCLSELEEDGFDVKALKERLENLLWIKNRQIELKKNRARLDQGMLEREVDNATIEQSQKLLDKVIKELELKLLEYQEKKASLVDKKAANCSEIEKLQGDMDQIEESFLSAEYDFHTTAAARW
uniref:Agenet-like domain-containing protein n=1 Tax=Oryza punctata TaxID=4537 RepID=A0A0E0JK22_ORYPU